MIKVLKNKIIRRPMFFLSLILCIALLGFLMPNQILRKKIDISSENTNIRTSNPERQPRQQMITPKKNFTGSSPDVHRIFTESSPKLKYKMGHVNVHLWQKVCSTSVDSLRQLPLFPLWPSIRGQPEMPNELVSIMSSHWSAQRVMGLLHSNLSGTYSFEISSLSVSEFWLSKDETPENAVFIAKINTNRLHGVNLGKDISLPKSKPVHLKQGKLYYFEIIHAMNDIPRDQVQVRWMMPGAASYTGIPKTSLSTVIMNDTSLDRNTRELVTSSLSLAIQQIILKKHTAHKWSDINFSKGFVPSYTRDNIHTLNYSDANTKIMTAFTECEYLPSYTRRRTFTRYQGVYATHFDDVFPYDHTDGKVWQGFHEQPDRKGNKLIEEGVVIHVVKMFMAQLNTKFPGQYSLANVVNVERNVDEIRGNRFFLELVLQEVKTKKFQRISEYVFQFKNNPNVLCKPRGLTWSPRTKIYAIINSKSQGPWIVHYIENMARVIHINHDDNVHFIIVDYGNNGVDIEEELKRNGLKHYTIIKKTGKFHKTLAIDEAVQSIEDKNSIVFLTDLHLDAPKDLFETVRKHTVQGLMAFTPVVFRLKNCARPETIQTTITGYWDSYAFGIFSTFKSDWNNFGGVNVDEFRYKWGGEDWEMVDRVLAKGLEINRLRQPFFYHFFHDKDGMWDKS